MMGKRKSVSERTVETMSRSSASKHDGGKFWWIAARRVDASVGMDVRRSCPGCQKGNENEGVARQCLLYFVFESIVGDEVVRVACLQLHHLYHHRILAVNYVRYKGIRLL